MARKKHTRTMLLGASDTIVSAPNLSLTEPNGNLVVDVDIDNGAGAAPSDTPVGTFELWTGDGLKFRKQSSTALDAQLANLTPNGNNLKSGTANFVGVPDTVAQIRYVRTSGGAASRAILTFTRG